MKTSSAGLLTYQYLSKYTNFIIVPTLSCELTDLSAVTTSRVVVRQVGTTRGQRALPNCQLPVRLISPLSTPDLTRPLQTNMELSYCSTTSSNCSSLAGYSSEKPTEVFWRQYKRGRKSLSLWRLLKLVFSKQEQRKTQHVNRSDSLHRFYEELYQREHSRLQSTLIREETSLSLDISTSRYYHQQEEEEENIYYLPFC